MKSPTSTEVQQVIIAFSQRCFMGGMPAAGTATAADATWVRTFLAESDELTPALVAQWPAAKQRAVADAFGDAIIFIEFRRREGVDQLPAGTLDGSTPERLVQPLLSGIAAAQESLHSP